MKRLIQLSILVVIVQMYFGCNDVVFDRVTSQDPKCQDFTQDCVNANGIDKFDYTVKIGKPLVDILFVNDNSGSMSTEQSEMGDKFPTFIQSLGDLDYRLMMITTDISDDSNVPRAINQNGALQDGNLIKFENGKSYLSVSDSNVADLFLTSVQRAETLECESELKAAKSSGRTVNYSKCPSGDERGIYAINLALKKNSSLFRSKAHLAIIILSDEDERSKSGKLSGYALESLDQPSSVINSINTYLGTDKTASAHAVIIKPGDSTCLSAQNNQALGVKGFEGVVYNELVQTLEGITGSICSSNYGNELGEIGSNIAEHVNSIKLACIPNEGTLSVGLTYSNSEYDINWTLNESQKTINFSQELPPGTSLHLAYECEEAKATAPE